MSDTVVLLTAGLPVEAARPIGFLRTGEPSEPQATVNLVGALGEELAAQVDLVCTTALRSTATRRRWIEEQLLAELAERYRKQGLELRWDETFIHWLVERERASTNQRDWERVMDEAIGPLLVPHLSTAGLGKPRSLIIMWKNGSMHVERHTAEGGT